MTVSDKSFWLRVWLCFFLYSIVASILIQLVLLPYFFTSWHAGNGLLKGHDWVTYHAVGAELSELVRSGEWSKWWNTRSDWIEVRTISFVYGLTVAKPWVLIPFNAFFHATAGLFLSFIFLGFVSGRRWAAVFGALPFIFFPSPLLWVSQIHKDGATNLAYASYLLGWLMLFRPSEEVNYKRLACAFILLTFGSWFAWLTRPYLGTILTYCSYLILSVGFLFYCRYEKFKSKSNQVFFASLLVAFLIVRSLSPYLSQNSYSGVGLTSSDIAISADTAAISADTAAISADTVTTYISKSNIIWVKTPFIPDWIENKAYAMSVTRNGFLNTSLGKSNIDKQVRFLNTLDLFRYIPRSLQVAVLAPFPADWFSSGSTSYNSFFKKIVIPEMVLIYLSVFLFIIFLLKNYKRRDVIVTLLFCMAMMIIFGITLANLGTLYRFRYFFLMTWVGVGISFAVSKLPILSGWKFSFSGIERVKAT